MLTQSQFVQSAKRDISCNGYRMVTINPTSTCIMPMEFVVPALEDYVDLNRSYFTMKLKLKCSSGTNLAGANSHVVINMAHSVIMHISMRLNGTLISPQNNTYAYKAFIETLLNYSHTRMGQCLRCTSKTGSCGLTRK